MSIKSIYKKLAAVVLSISLMTSCGPESILIAEGGIGGTGISMGAITAFGSVYVNGVRFDTSDIQTIQVNGVNSDESALRVGMIVRVYGNIDMTGTQGIATGIAYESELKGPISSVDTTLSTIDILGQTVHITGNTVFSNEYDATTIFTSVSDLYPLSGDAYVIELSGHTGINNEIYASRIVVKEVWTDNSEIELKGTVTAISSNELSIGTLTVNYASITPLDFIPMVGAYVKIKGSYSSVSSILNASKVEQREQGISGKEGEEFEIEGVINQAPNDNGIMLVNGQQVDIRVAQYENGDSTLLTSGTHVEVEGSFNAAGVLMAEEIEFRVIGEELELNGVMSDVYVERNSISVSGIEIYITNTTIMQDERDIAPDEKLNFTELVGLVNGNVNVKVKYYTDNNLAKNIATRLSVKD